MSSHNEDSEKVVSTTSRADRLKEIDALYRSQIKQIYNESKEVVKEKEADNHTRKMASPSSSIKKISSNANINIREEKRDEEIQGSRTTRHLDSDSRINKLSVQDLKSEDEKIRASTFLQGESTRTIEILRK